MNPKGKSRPRGDPDQPIQDSKPAGKATLKSVAAAIGVSATTVSNAFNRPDQLSDRLREQILQQAKAMGYFGPDIRARAMRRRELHEIGVVFHHNLGYAMSDPHTLAFLRGVASELDKHQLSLQIIPKMGRKLMLHAAFQTTSDMLIIHTEIGAEFLPELVGANKPFVLIDSGIAGFPSICTRDREGGRLAMRHALSRRPDKVIILGFHSSFDDFANANLEPTAPERGFVGTARITGYYEAAAEAGFSADDIVNVSVDSQDAESAFARLMECCPCLTDPALRIAVIAMSDRMALDVINGRKLRPDFQPVAIVGFDDIPEAATTGLTTVRQDAFAKGKIAVQMLLANDRSQRELDVKLVERET